MWFRRRRHAVSDDELSAYLDGELDGQALARVEAHVDACAACRETLTELRAVRRGLRALPRARAPRSFTLREAEVPPRAPARAVGAPGRTMPLLSGVTAAAVLAFVVLVGVDVGDTSDGADDAIPAATAALALYEAPAAEERDTSRPEATGAAGTPSLGAGARQQAGERGVDEAAPEEDVSDEGEDDARTGLRLAEAATAAAALAAGGALAIVWWRRRA